MATPQTFTLQVLNQLNGVQNDRICISVDGQVFDCTSGKKNYGPNGGYHLFAGHDITYALAMNSLKPKDVDQFGTFEFDATQQKRLDGWKKFFAKKYKLVGTLRTAPSQSKL